MKNETCFGCGEKAPQHPVVGIMGNGSGGWKSEPVCNACWTNPEHRKTPIKAHFFLRGQEGSALANAGSSSLG